MLSFLYTFFGGGEYGGGEYGGGRQFFKLFLNIMIVNYSI
jgi:hypothetical protein